MNLDERMQHKLYQWAARLRQTLWSKKLPARGFDQGRVSSGWVESLSDDDLERLNRLLPWQCFTADTQGRRFGSVAWQGKRETPQTIPDERILALNERIPLHGLRVLEIGCFEGVHTIGLARCGAQVTAVDSRIENVVKTLVRTGLFGCPVTSLVCDVERPDHLARLSQTDVVHHVGVLYHLLDPVTHLKALAAKTTTALLLDTHYASDGMLNAEYTVDGDTYRYHRYAEHGRDEVFSGMHDHAKWLRLDDIRQVFAATGFAKFDLLANAVQRNGPRFTALISRTN